jgi:hypothetical protein
MAKPERQAAPQPKHALPDSPDAVELAQIVSRLSGHHVRPEQVDDDGRVPRLLATLREWRRRPEWVPRPEHRTKRNPLRVAIRAALDELQRYRDYVGPHRDGHPLADKAIAVLAECLRDPHPPFVERRPAPPLWHSQAQAIFRELQALFAEAGTDLRTADVLAPIVCELLARVGVRKTEPTVRTVLVRKRPRRRVTMR